MTKVGDVLPGPDGPREVVWVENADDYLARRTADETPVNALRGSSMERNALYGGRPIQVGVQR